MSKYGHHPLEWFERIVDRLGGEEAAERFLRGEPTVTEPESGPRGEPKADGPKRRWHQKDGILYLPELVSDGTTGEGWIARFKGQGFRVSECAERVLRSPDFRSTDGVTYRVAVLPGHLFADTDRVTANIRAEAGRRGPIEPHPEVACLIRLAFSDGDGHGPLARRRHARANQGSRRRSEPSRRVPLRRRSLAGRGLRQVRRLVEP